MYDNFFHFIILKIWGSQVVGAHLCFQGALWQVNRAETASLSRCRTPKIRQGHGSGSRRNGCIGIGNLSFGKERCEYLINLALLSHTDSSVVDGASDPTASQDEHDLNIIRLKEIVTPVVDRRSVSHLSWFFKTSRNNISSSGCIRGQATKDDFSRPSSPGS
jgi:hypothetical protein